MSGIIGSAGSKSHIIGNFDNVVFFGEHNTTLTSANVIMNFDTNIYNPDGNYSTGVYTVPSAGDYLVIATSKGQSGTSTDSGTGLRLYKNGSEVDASAAIGYVSATDTRLQGTLSMVTSCVAGNTLQINNYLEGPGNSNNVHGGLLSIIRVGA